MSVRPRLAVVKPAPRITPGGRPDRGYLAVYRPDESNRCPGCGRSHWHVGRTMAQCAFCDTALPIAGAGNAE